MQRVILRQWKESDLDPFAAMNDDLEVMRYLAGPWTRQQSEAAMLRLRTAIEQRGWGLWAVEIEGQFGGFTGLNIPSFNAPFTPCVEIGWRFRREYWGRGLAYEAAQQAMKYGFEVLKLAEIVSFTAEGNRRSRRLMERLGFTRRADEDFDHPMLPEGHKLRRHILYRRRGFPG